MAVKIERLHPRGGIVEYPVREALGYKLADPAHGKKRHHAEFAVHVGTLEEAADLIERSGFSIWMARPGKRASLIGPASLKIIR